MAVEIEIAEAAGIMPRAVMLVSMRFHYAEFERIMNRRPRNAEQQEKLLKDASSALAAAMEAAQAAAPYFHARLSPEKVFDGKHLPESMSIPSLTDRQLAGFIGRLEEAKDLKMVLEGANRQGRSSS